MSSVAETEFKLSREAVARAGWRRRYRCHQSGEHFVRFERSLGGRDGRAVSVRPLPRTSRQFFSGEAETHTKLDLVLQTHESHTVPTHR